MPSLLKFPNLLYIAVGALLIGSIAYFLGFQTYQRFKVNRELLQSQSTPLSPQAIDQLLARIGKLVDLPKDETPVIATVSDLNQLKDQSFFNQAQIGDKVLIFKNNKKAYLYRPSQNQVINIGPINISDSDKSQSKEAEATLSAQTNQVTSPINVSFLNGTKAAGIASKGESKVKSSIKFEIKAQTGNTKGDYEKTQVILLNPNLQPQAAEIAKVLNATISDLPKVEKQPENVDVLVLLGNDQI
jgi:hypothetical protein